MWRNLDLRLPGSRQIFTVTNTSGFNPLSEEEAVESGDLNGIEKAVLREAELMAAQFRRTFPRFADRVFVQNRSWDKNRDAKEAKKIQDRLKEQKKKKISIKKEFSLISYKPNGLNQIKKILGEIKDVELKYVSAGNYILKSESGDPKHADNLLKKILENIENDAKKNGLIFSIKKE